MRNYRQWLSFVSYLAVAVGAALPAVASIANAASVPDFSGRWAHVTWPGFEPPPLGPGPVTNKVRMRGGPQPGVSNWMLYAGDYTNPILKPQAAEVVKKRGEQELSGLIQPSPMNQCWPLGGPFIFTNFGMEMFQQPNKVTIVYSWNNEVRRVRMNQPHPARVTPSWYGDSVGYYEGDSLVIDTVGIKADRPFAMVDIFGTPYTNALHVVERYRLLDYEAAKEGLERDAKENWRLGPASPSPFLDDLNYRGKHLQLQFTVEDQGVFTMPWSATITYRRPSVTEWFESVCAENQRGYYVGGNAAVPTAERPDF